MIQNQFLTQQFLQFTNKNYDISLKFLSDESNFHSSDTTSFNDSLDYYQSNQLPKIQKKLQKKRGRTWNKQEDQILIECVLQNFGSKNWELISQKLPNRNANQCMQRWQKLQPFKERKSWTKEEDSKVIEYVEKYGTNWSLIASQIEGRNGKQVRERYLNKLNPKINRVKFSDKEDQEILRIYNQIGPKWKQISRKFTNRPENMIKNRFYSHIRKTYQALDDSEIQNLDNNNNKTQNMISLQNEKQILNEQEEQTSIKDKEDNNKESENLNQIQMIPKLDVNFKAQPLQSPSFILTPNQISPSQFFNFSVSFSAEKQNPFCDQIFNFEENQNLIQNQDINNNIFQKTQEQVVQENTQENLIQKKKDLLLKKNLLVKMLSQIQEEIQEYDKKIEDLQTYQQEDQTIFIN